MKTRTPFLRRFILLGGVVFISLIFFILLFSHYQEWSAENYTRMNLASRQRTFVEEMVKQSLILNQSSEDAELSQSVKDEFAIVIQKWENAQRALEYGDPTYSISGKYSREAGEVLKELMPAFSALRKHFHIQQDFSKGDGAQPETVLALADQYQRIAARLQYQFEKDARIAAERQSLVVVVFVVLISVMLVLAYRFLVIPALRQLRDQNLDLQSLNENLEESVQAKSKFLAKLSHELQTPLQGIIGMTGLMLKSATDQTSRESLLTVNRSAEKLSGIISGILDHSLLESGLLNLHKTEFKLREALEEVCEVYRPAVVEKSLKLHLSVDPGLPSTVIQDVSRLQQILISLLSNAIKFTDFGEIELKAELLSTQNNFAQLKLSVRDTGCGMEQEHLDQLFQAFVRPEQESEKAFEGLGLGLALCRDIVRLMNGYMRVESKPGKGSLFSFTMVAELPGSTAELAVDLSQIQGKRAIVVDSNKNSLRIMVRMLGSWGIQATPFNSPDLVSEVMPGLGKYDMCILDLHMQEMDGKELAMRIRSHFTREELPIIVLSAAADAVVSDEAEYFDALISKPVKSDHLLRSILKLVTQDGITSSDAGIVPGPKGLRVLIAEDNPLQLAVAERNLALLGLRADKVSTESELLGKLRQSQYDLLLVDNQLGSSAELEKLLKQKEKESSSPVIFNLQSEHSNGGKGIADDSLKDISAGELSSRIHHWFSESDQD